MYLNENLRKARRQRNDEFYTQLSDIENELLHYTAHFSGKDASLAPAGPQGMLPGRQRRRTRRSCGDRQSRLTRRARPSC